MRFLATGLILVAVALSNSFAQPQKSISEDLKGLPYEELQRRLEGEKSKPNPLWEDVKAIADEMIRQGLDDAEPRYWRAYALLRTGEPEEALEGFRKVISLEPDYLEAYMGRAEAYSIKGDNELAKLEMEKAAEKGYPVRKMQKIPKLKEYLADPKFFIKLIEKEPPTISPVRDPFACPIPLPPPEESKETLPPKWENIPPLPSLEPYPRDVQQKKMEEMERLCKEIGEAISTGKDKEALEKFRQVKALFKDVLDGRITIDEIRIKMDSLWNQVRQAHLERIMREELLSFKEEAEKLLEYLFKAYHDRMLGPAETYNAQLTNMLKRKFDSTEPEFEPLKDKQKEKDAEKEEISQEYDAKREEIYSRVAVLKEFKDNFSPHIRLFATITGEGVQSEAYLETDFEGKSVTHVKRENDTLILPSGADLTVRIIEENSISADYEKDVIELRDNSVTTGKIIQETERDVTVRTQPDSSITISKDGVGTIFRYKETVKILMSRSFPKSSGSASGPGSGAP